MRLALAPEATGAEPAEVVVGEVEAAEVVGGARGKHCLDMPGSCLRFSILKSGVQDLFHKPHAWNEREDKIEGV